MQTNEDFSPEEQMRYSRHFLLPELGEAGQLKLKNSRVLVVGAGGLGSPLLLYLAAAGIGTIGIVDADRVDDSNLQRQVLFDQSHVGVAKVAAARARLLALNPHIHIQAYDTRLTAANALEILQNFDLVADGSDNFPTRYLVNDACVLLDKPLVYASIYRFEGQVSVFNLRDAQGERGPNYRDLYPTPPASDAIPDCAEGGVLGVLAGIIGSMQASEVIKIAAGIGTPLRGRLFTFDALSFETHTFKIRCRNEYIVTELIDYEHFCNPLPPARAIRELRPEDLHRGLQTGEIIQLIDVREAKEYQLVNLGGTWIPMSELPVQAGRILRGGKVVVHCKTGARSARAIRELEEMFGFDNLYNLQGGILAYIEACRPDLPRY